MIRALWSRFQVSVSATGVIPALALVMALCIAALVALPLIEASDAIIESAMSKVTGFMFPLTAILVLAVLSQWRRAPNAPVTGLSESDLEELRREHEALCDQRGLPRPAPISDESKGLAEQMARESLPLLRKLAQDPRRKAWLDVLRRRGFSCS